MLCCEVIMFVTFRWIKHFVCENFRIQLERINFVRIFRLLVFKLTILRLFVDNIRNFGNAFGHWFHQLGVKLSFRTKCLQEKTNVLNGSNVVVQLFVCVARKILIFLNDTHEEWMDLQWLTAKVYRRSKLLAKFLSEHLLGQRDKGWMNAYRFVEFRKTDWCLWILQ